MGNCLKSSPSIDDLALLRENQIIGRESSSEQIEPPPSYQFLYSTPSTSRFDSIGSWVKTALGDKNETIHQQSLPVFYPSPNVSRPASQLTEDEQIKIVQRIGLIQHLPTGLYEQKVSSKKNRECAICMCEFLINDAIRFLPCMHIYHTKCIDDWLMRSFTCPSCLEPVDAALLSTYQTD